MELSFFLNISFSHLISAAGWNIIRNPVSILSYYSSLSWIYWGLFVNPRLIGDLLGMDPESPEFIERLKKHAKRMTAQVMK